MCYPKVVHVNVHRMEAYVEEMTSGDTISTMNIQKDQKSHIKALYEGVVCSLRRGPDHPHQHAILHEIAMPGMTFKDKNTLLTGVSKGSIGVEILKGLISSGAHVVITTSCYSHCTVEYYQDIYQRFSAQGSALTVMPFNQGSKQDVEALVDYIYATLGMDLDYILPFSAVPENGHEIDGLDNKLELAHHIIMLINLLQILGAIKTKKVSSQLVTWPTLSKISLETLFNCWNSKSWGEYLCLAGAVIGWTCSMGLMDATNIVTWEVKAYGNVNVVPCANFKFDLPTLKPASAFEELSKSHGIINSEKVIIITGFAEVSPWHSSWTQWEMEAHGEFTIEGCIDMAQIMGSIKHFDSHLKDSTLHVGWVDAKTGEPYEKEILSHASVCLIGAYLSFPCDLLLNSKCRFPELFCGYDPKKVFNQEIKLIHDQAS
ncbi:hypothetical protein F5J12DRAFT_966299 [Pisolithus orientalis]|uniref:uncharacterized protein n=1 Tax=Pisolithus orientalis TaxID=936130 RepID=UPI00222580E9|nr:uncharacterized protein F5J12DRAFT_966299 [Pisolithus orientalis]KAI5990824.1 hypothetical protein F5J12DRAFT_966299 [Pisolithus orientalis]